MLQFNDLAEHGTPLTAIDFENLSIASARTVERFLKSRDGHSKTPVISKIKETKADVIYFAAIAGPGAGGTIITFGPDARKNAAASEVVKRFTGKNIDTEGFTLYGYVAVQVIAAGIKAAGSSDPQAVADKLHSGLTVDTVIGPLTYNAKGDITLWISSFAR